MGCSREGLCAHLRMTELVALKVEVAFSSKGVDKKSLKR